ncbi:MAG: hypothetical protein U5R31_08340 [Acidimicrobiia bacterium]|nr:hypothetical protein [Acidimicrobiia bacterium]
MLGGLAHVAVARGVVDPDAQGDLVRVRPVGCRVATIVRDLLVRDRGTDIDLFGLFPPVWRGEEASKPTTCRLPPVASPARSAGTTSARRCCGSSSVGTATTRCASTLPASTRPGPTVAIAGEVTVGGPRADDTPGGRGS